LLHDGQVSGDGGGGRGGGGGGFNSDIAMKQPEGGLGPLGATFNPANPSLVPTPAVSMPAAVSIAPYTSGGLPVCLFQPLGPSVSPLDACWRAGMSPSQVAAAFVQAGTSSPQSYKFALS
jgi:hypothetical protein